MQGTGTICPQSKEKCIKKEKRNLGNFRIQVPMAH